MLYWTYIEYITMDVWWTWGVYVCGLWVCMSENVCASYCLNEEVPLDKLNSTRHEKRKPEGWHIWPKLDKMCSARTDTHTHTHTHTHRQIHTNKHAYTHVCTQTHTEAVYAYFSAKLSPSLSNALSIRYCLRVRFLLVCELEFDLCLFDCL